MKKLIAIFTMIFVTGVAFAEWSDTKKEEFRADLDQDGIEDLFIEESNYNFEHREEDDSDVLKIRIKICIRLMNKDGSVKKEISFSDNKNLYDDEYDGCLGYSIENNMIVRNLVTGRHSYKDYTDSYFIYDKKSDNWKLVKQIILESPMHINKRTEKTFETESIYLYDKQTLKYSGK